MSELVISTEQHLIRSPEGIFVRGNEDYAFFSRYVGSFSRVKVAARVRDVPEHAGDLRAVEGPGVSVLALPEFRGLAQLGSTAPSVLSTAWRIAGGGDAHLLRVPGVVGAMLWMALRARGRAYGVEVVADPDEGFRRNAFDSPIAPAARIAATYMLRSQCAHAAAASYVTRRTLQQVYPASGPAYSYSSIDIGAEAFSRAEAVLARIECQPDELEDACLVFVGRLYRPSKGLDVLLRALARLAPEWPRLRLRVIGGGALLDSYRKQAEASGLTDRVEFLGEMNDSRMLYDQLSRADVFVLPSRQEGLPRSVIEAMAVGLPVLATPVGGTAEIVERRFLFPVDDDLALGARLVDLLRSRHERARLSSRNAALAREFDRDRLNAERHRFLAFLADHSGQT